MQFDMHYYGTFAMAYAAGLDVADAAIVATSAQLVDDNNLTSLHRLQSGEAVMGVATAHHPVNAGLRELGIGGQNDDRLIWVPFHFLPGNEGATFEERLVCRKNSAVAQQMVNYYTDAQTINSHRTHGLHLMGIAAHVYSDTFSHYGFSGIMSPLNSVDVAAIFVDSQHGKSILSYIADKAKDFYERFTAAVAGAVNLGHGSVATYPDRPYLKWGYTQVDGQKLVRDNPATFLEACEALHGVFRRFAVVYYGPAHAARADYSSIRATVQKVLATEADVDGRIAAWTDALAKGQLGEKVDCPKYSDSAWIDELLAAPSLQFNAKAGHVESNAYQFFAAADYHRNYVLKRLLSSAGLLVA
jgi:hypothetical protein